MKTVAELCKPRPSVFDDTTTDDVLDITNLLNGTGCALAERTAQSYVQGEMF